LNRILFSLGQSLLTLETSFTVGACFMALRPGTKRFAWRFACPGKLQPIPALEKHLPQTFV
jgi:hypothetical protein